MWSGVVPQQPPTIADAVALDELARATAASGSGCSGKIVSPFGPWSGRPAFGMQWTGFELVSPRKRIASRMSSGPVEQLRPMMSTSSASSVVSTAPMSVPSSILPPLGSSDTLHWIGSRWSSSLNASRAPKIAALTSRMSCAVSMMIRSAPPRDQALGLLGEHLDELAEADLAERRIVGGRQIAGRADRAGDEPVLAGRLAGDLGRLDVDLHRVLGEAPLLELQPAGLEGVGLDDDRAGVEHRAVDALDHVGPVEHQHLVAATRAAGSRPRG